MPLKWLIGSLLASFFDLALTHADPTSIPKTRPQVSATYAKQPPTIDGKLDDAAWRAAESSSSFVQKFPLAGAPPSEATTIRVLYDKTKIYLGIHCTQQHVPIVAKLTRRDQQSEADWVQINIDTMNGGTSAFQFSVNAAGVLGDGLRFNDTEYSAEWDEIWDAQVTRLADGWSAEIAIPLLALQFEPQAVQSWGLQVRRYTSTRQELDEWSYIPRTTAGEVTHYGLLTGLVALRHHNTVEIRPYMMGRVSWFDMSSAGSPTPPASYHVTAGVDFKWHLTRGLVLSLTVNPDLAQLESDQMIFNLTSFENFLPEKRPFFLGGFDVFQTPMQAFYSRRIGIAPPVPSLRTDPAAEERLISAPGPSSIYGAAKLSGTIGRHITLGLLSTLTARNDALVWRASGGPVARLAEPLTLYNLLRLRLLLAGNTSVGLLATTVNRFEPTQDYPQVRTEKVMSALCPDGARVRPGRRCFHDSYVVSADGIWHSRDRSYVASGQVMVTSSLNGPARTLPDGTVIRSGNMSPGGRISVAKESGPFLIS